MKKFLFALMFMIVMISLVSAGNETTTFGYNNLNKPTLSRTVVDLTSSNVNNSDFWDGHSWSEVADWLHNQTYSGSTYNKTYNDFSYNFTDIVQGVYNVTYNSLTDDSMADTLHRHSELSANDGTPDRAVVVDALGKVGIGGNPLTQLHVQDPTALTIRVSNNEVDSTATYGYMLSSQYDSAGESEGTMMIGSANTAEEVNQLWIGGGSSAINTATEIQFYTATDASTRKGTQVMTIDNAGKVGIGVTAPGNDLHVHSTSDTRMLLTNSVTGATSEDGTYLRQNGVDFYIGNHEVGDLYLFTDNDLSHGVSILTGGNVGIGTYNPTEKLHAVGNALIEGDLNVTGNIIGNNFYAEGWYHNHTATALSFAVQDVFYNLTMDNFKLNGFTADDSNDLITSQVAGLYKATFSAGGDGENNHEYVTTILINGITQENCEVHKKMTAGGDITTMNGDCFIDLGVGDYVQLGTQDYGATSSGNFYSSNLNLVRIGD